MKTKEFFDYLLYIGIVSNENLQLLTTIVEKKTNEYKDNKSIDKTTFMKSLMGDYLTSLNKDELLKIGINIYDQYISNKSLTISKHLLKLFNIFENILFYNLKSFFIIFKKKIFNDKNSNSKIFQRSKSTDKLFYVSNQKNKNKNNLSYSNNLNNINSYNNNYYNNNQMLSSSYFLSKLNEYNNKKEREKIREKCKNDDEIGMICTFTPNLSLTKKTNNKFRKKNKYNKPIKIEPEGKTEEKQKKKLDKDIINKLYYDFQKKNIMQEQLKHNIDKENGITFSPKVNVNSPYNKRIKDNFYERNQKLLIEKKDFIEGFNLMRDMQLKGMEIKLVSQNNK